MTIDLTVGNPGTVLWSFCLLLFGGAREIIEATTAPMFWCCPIPQQSSEIMKILSGSIMMKLKSAKLPLSVISKMPIKLETEKWLTDPIWLCSVFNTKAAVHGRL